MFNLASLSFFTMVYFWIAFTLPTALLADTLRLSWQAVTQDTSGQAESAPIYYAIYGDTLPTFIPDEETLIAATTATNFEMQAQSNKNYYFTIQVFDSWGNGSSFSPLVGTAPWVIGELCLILEGAYDAAGDTMRTVLQKRGLIPLRSPYTAAPRETPALPDDVVDWIEVQLRDGENPSLVRMRQSFLLRKDGRVIELDGTLKLGLVGVDAGNHYVAASHRNHLAVMSAQPLVLNSSTIEFYDFSDSAERFYQNGGLLLESGVYGLISSDANHNGQVQNDDKNDYWRLQVGLSGYREADFNLNAEVQNDDKNDFWRRHVGKGSQVP